MILLDELWASTYRYFSNVEMWIYMLSVALKILIIVIGARIIARIARKTIAELLKQRGTDLGDKPERRLITIDDRRLITISTLLSNVVGYVVYFMMGLMILTQFIEVTPILAGAGVIGLAVGFGAQSLVKDVITGFFILFEDQFAVGDFVKIGSYQGTILEFGLRVTKVKNWTGEIYIIPNGSIGEVTNVSKAESVAAVDISIAYEENIATVRAILEPLLVKIAEETEDITGEAKLLGVQDLGDSDVVLRVTAICKPVTHWGVARMLRERIKAEFDEKGIEIPYPRLVTYRRAES